MAPLKTYQRTRKPLSTLQPHSIISHRDKKRKKKMTEEPLKALGLIHKSKHLRPKVKPRPRPTPVELTPISVTTLQTSNMLSASAKNNSKIPLFPQSFTDLGLSVVIPHENTFDRLLKTGPNQGLHLIGKSSKPSKEDGVTNCSGSSSLELTDTSGEKSHHYNLRKLRPRSSYKTNFKSKQLSFLRVNSKNDNSYSDDQASVIKDPVGTSISSPPINNQVVKTSTPLLNIAFFKENYTNVSPITSELFSDSDIKPFKRFEQQVENASLQASDTKSELYPGVRTSQDVNGSRASPHLLNHYMSKDLFDSFEDKVHVSEISKRVESISQYTGTYDNGCSEPETCKTDSIPTSCSVLENTSSKYTSKHCISQDLFDSFEDKLHVSEFSKSVEASSQYEYDYCCSGPENSKFASYPTSSVIKNGSSIETSLRSLTVQDNNCISMKEDLSIEEDLKTLSVENNVITASDVNGINMLPVEHSNYVTLRNRRVQWCEASIEQSPLVKESELCLIAEEEEEEEEKIVQCDSPKKALNNLKFSLPSTCKDLLPNCKKSLNRRRSLAIRRLSHSVVPGKQIGVPKPESASFRDFHRISSSGFYHGSALPMPDLVAINTSIGELSVITKDDDKDTNSCQPSARNIVLQKCGQEHPVSFHEAYPNEFFDSCRKIGEGLYGEVFMWSNGQQSSVLKIIPIDGEELVNGERQKGFDEILSEIVITKELSDLRLNSKFNTSGFAEVINIWCLQGRYPSQLVDQWNEFAEKSGTENDSPTIFNDEQLFIVLELGNGGVDLEKFVFNSAKQAMSALLQTAHSLAVAEKCIEFEHRDLHWGNVLVSKTKDKVKTYVIDGNTLSVCTQGVQVTIIDYTLSRMTYEGCCIFNDLSIDPMLFESVGDYQFDIYRLMKDQCGNTWSNFEPYNNVLWVHYLVDKMINGVHYTKKLLKNHTAGMKSLQFLKDNLLKSASAVDCLSILS